MEIGKMGRAWPGIVRRDICLAAVATVMAVQGATGMATARTSVSKEIEQPVQKAIDTRQSAQAAQEKWDGERAKLVAAYERLKAENEQLTAANTRLSGEAARQEAVNRELIRERQEALRIQAEMMPFLKGVAGRLNRIRAGDAPFLARERTARLTRLDAILDDPEISGAEKYRKTMEALFVEAEYGNTVEVYQEKILLDGTEVLGDIFRLGRVSLFFLSLDRETAAVFDVAGRAWAVLPASHIPAVSAAVEMAAKHRPMEITALPIGRLSTGGSGE